MTDRSKSYLHLDPNTASSESKRLEEQAMLFLEAEVAVLRQLGICRAKTILDLGCGNGFFLGRLSKLLEAEVAIGIDRNANFLSVASGDKEARFHELDLLDEKGLERIFQTYRPDLVINRFVLQHMSPVERQTFLGILARLRDKRTCFVFTDVDERETSHTPRDSSVQALILEKIDTQKRLGGDRTVAGELPPELAALGFIVNDQKVSLRAEQVGWDKWKAVYWPILRSGQNGKDAESEDTKRLLSQGEAWFDRASQDPEYSMTFNYRLVLAK